MNHFTEEEEEFTLLAEKPIDVQAILSKYLTYWKYFLVSVLMFAIIAIVYLSVNLPLYKVTTSILFHDDAKGGTSEVNAFREMNMVNRLYNADNEIEILKKSLVSEKVVRKLHLYFTYLQIEPIALVENTPLKNVLPGLSKRKVAVLYGDELPFMLQAPEELLANVPGEILFNLEIDARGVSTYTGTYNENDYRITAKASDTVVTLPFGRLKILSRGRLTPAGMMLRVSLQDPLNVADGIVNALEVELTSKTSSVADLTFVCGNSNMGVDILKNYIETYNELGITEQLLLAEKTSEVIDNHLATLSNELSNVESLAQNYKQSQGLTDIESQADLYNAEVANSGQQKMEVETQYAIVTRLHDHMQQNSNHDQLIPSNSGIVSPGLNSQITTYNALVLERNKLARIASGSNQTMIDLNNQIASTFNSVYNGLEHEKNNLAIQQREINAKYYQNNARLRAIPRQERVYTEIKRQQSTKEELFLFLLQKKEEKFMNMTSLVPNSKLIDNIRIRGVVWPRKFLTLAIALCLGLLLPFIYIKMKDVLRYQIVSKEELEEITSVPVLGDIPKSIQTETIVVKKEGNDCFNEMMRLLRANLLFVIDSKEKKVINTLSSISGEGKSFFTINLAISLALLEKKVLIIELDIRKPRLALELGLNGRKGMTHFLSGNLSRNELVTPSGVNENLSVILAGAIPPNPNELLAKPMLDDLVRELRNEFDFILIDTPPLGLVSDSLLLNRLADINLFVARAGFTPRKYIADAGRYFRDKKLKNMYFILNGVNLDAAEYRYGIGKKYKYGYA